MNDREALVGVGLVGVACLLGVLAIPIVLFGATLDDGVVLVLSATIIGVGLIVATRGTGRVGQGTDETPPRP